MHISLCSQGIRIYLRERARSVRQPTHPWVVENLAVFTLDYSHSIVAGGLELTS